MAYEIVTPSGMAGLGSAEGDALGEGCLCGDSGVCNTPSKQGAAMARLRAAMRAAGLPAGSGNWSTSEQNALNALASRSGFPTSSKFLVDGGPCRALKAALATPVPVVTPPAGGAPTCASLLASMPAIPEGTPIASVMAVMAQVAPPGFNITACFPGANPVPVGPSTPVGPAVPVGPETPLGPPVQVTVEEADNATLYVGLGALALVAVGGLAYALTRPKMKKNGRRSRRRAA